MKLEVRGLDLATIKLKFHIFNYGSKVLICELWLLWILMSIFVLFIWWWIWACQIDDKLAIVCFSLLKHVDMNTLLLIVSQLMIIWYNWCWVVLVIIIHALGVDKCVAVVKLWWLYDFCENELKMKKLDFDEFEWIRMIEFLLLIISFWWEIVWEKNWGFE